MTNLVAVAQRNGQDVVGLRKPRGVRRFGTPFDILLVK